MLASAGNLLSGAAHAGSTPVHQSMSSSLDEYTAAVLQLEDSLSVDECTMAASLQENESTFSMRSMRSSLPASAALAAMAGHSTGEAVAPLRQTAVPSAEHHLLQVQGSVLADQDAWRDGGHVMPVALRYQDVLQQLPGAPCAMALQSNAITPSAVAMLGVSSAASTASSAGSIDRSVTRNLLGSTFQSLLAWGRRSHSRAAGGRSGGTGGGGPGGSTSSKRTSSIPPPAPVLPTTPRAPALLVDVQVPLQAQAQMQPLKRSGSPPLSTGAAKRGRKLGGSWSLAGARRSSAREDGAPAQQDSAQPAAAGASQVTAEPKTLTELGVEGAPLSEPDEVGTVRVPQTPSMILG